jgi:hypothetical protein
VGNGARFLLVTGRAEAPPSDPLVVSLEAGHVPDGLPAHFAPPCLFGAWDGADGVVALSTNPFHEGRVMLRKEGDDIAIRWIDFHGRVEMVPPRA